MGYTGYSSNGAEYQINSARGTGFVESAPVGASITGSDGSQWLKNSDGSTTISKGSNTWSVGSALGNLQNALDRVTATSDKSSARSLSYAQQNQEWSANQAAIARNFNAAEAAKNRDWQQYMSDTAHQREVADLKAAGLNPVLSASGGNGAPVSSGATASASVPSGASGQSDMSGSSAIVSLLGSMLAAQTQIANTAVNAKVQESVAEKYTAMSQITAEIAAAASMRNAATAAAASRYGADAAAAASRYGHDMQYRIKQDFPDSLLQIANSFLNGEGGTGGAARSIYEYGKDYLSGLFGDGSFASKSGHVGSFGGK